MTKLQLLHSEIGNCTVCTEYTQLIKSSDLERGSCSNIMVIGIAPGNTEVKQNRAFSGQAGRTLFNWLKQARIGEDENEIRSKIYLTSMIKCSLLNNLLLRKMFRNCSHFLDKQVQLVKPKLIMTLGSDVFNTLFNNRLNLDEIVGNSYRSKDLFEPDMFKEELPFANVDLIIPFPHPSGRSTWFQNEENKRKLDVAIQILSDNYRKTKT